MISADGSLQKELRLLFRNACRRLGIAAYRVHQICLPEQKLLYIPIPKNACSSTKHALYEIEHGKKFDYERQRKRGYRDIHDYYEKQDPAFTAVDKLAEKDEYFRFAVVRDPVGRLISCYRNRVVDLGDLEASRLRLKAMGLPVAPDLNTFVLNLNKYRKANTSIDHHARPQHRFLGGTLDYLDRIYPLEEIDDLKEMLRRHRPGLKMRREKAGGTEVSLGDLSGEALRHALKIYERDYRLLSAYFTPDRVWSDYREQKKRKGS